MSNHCFHFVMMLSAKSLLLMQAILPTAPLRAASIDISELINLGEQAFIQEDYREALQRFMTAKAQAEKSDSVRLSYVATYDMGICYFMISENGEALSYFFEAQQIVEKYHLGHEAMNKINNGIAGVYFEERNYEKAEELCINCLEEASHEGDSSSCATYCSDLAILNNKLHRFELTEKYINEGLTWAPGDSAIIYKMKVADMERLYLQKNYDEVLQKGPQLIDATQVSSNDRTVVMTYLITILRERGQLDEAFRLAWRARQLSTQRNRPSLYDEVSKLYQASGNMEQALIYKDSVILFSDSLTKLQDRRLTENSRIKLEVYKLRTEMEGEVNRLTQHRQVALLFSAICVLLLVIAVLMYRAQRQRNEKAAQQMQLRLEQEKNQKLVAERQVRETELKAHYQEEMLKNEIEQKKRELSTVTTFVSSRNELIMDILSSISDVREGKGMQQLTALANRLNQMLKDSGEHDEFLINFQSAYPEFTVALMNRHPELSASDVRFLTYVRMNLSLKEIAVFLNIEPESCKRRKIRIGKKLGLESSADLYQYISRF